jgi:hypothetical protein
VIARLAWSLLLPIALAPTVALAQPQVADEPVPLRANFSPLETTVALTAAAAGAFLMGAGNTVFDSPRPSMGVPDPESVDARISRSLYRADGSSSRFLGGAPDVGGYVLPALPLLIYGASSLSLAVRDRPLWPAGDVNPQHRLLAYVEAMGWVYLITGSVKYAVGRPRPYNEAANNHPELRPRASEDNLSFFSGHAASTFALGAFVAEDVSRRLRHGALANASPVERFAAGTLLPYAVGYGVPVLVAYSRLVDQQHWPSDVAMGTLAGTLIAHLVYNAHFDEAGRPRRRHLLNDAHVVPVVGRRPDGGGDLTLALLGRF